MCLQIGHDTVTAEAGALVHRRRPGVAPPEPAIPRLGTEIGNLSVGSAACAGTKDSSMPGEFGQVGLVRDGRQDGAPGREPPRGERRSGIPR